MIHKIVATVLIVHSRHTGSSIPATTGTNILSLLVTRLVVIICRILLEPLASDSWIIGCHSSSSYNSIRDSSMALCCSSYTGSSNNGRICVGST